MAAGTCRGKGENPILSSGLTIRAGRSENCFIGHNREGQNLEQRIVSPRAVTALEQNRPADENSSS
jgi:hypothetical protein